MHLARLGLLVVLLLPACRSEDERKAAATASADPVGSCVKVLEKVAACKVDPGFRTALFRKSAGADRAAMEARFDASAASWNDAGGARRQCEAWATSEPAGRTFARRDALNRLAVEAGLGCEAFGREIDDEGGPPATPAP